MGLLEGWFRVAEPEPGVFLIEEPLHDERVKSYLILGIKRALLLDAGTGAGDLPGVVSSLTGLPLTLLISHAHWDHIGHAHAFAAAGVEVLSHASQEPALAAGVENERLRRGFAPDRLSGPLPRGFDIETAVLAPVEVSCRIEDGDEIDLGGRRLAVVMAPGHCAGLTTLLDREHGLLFSTDAAYEGELYAQMADSDVAVYAASLERLARLTPGLRAVYPAHGPAPIGPERLGTMRDAMAAVAAGRRPEAVADGVARHRLGDVVILVAG